jgi:hypothetical protein
MSAGTSVVRVNPVSIRQYASAASDRFAAARRELETMVREAVEVHYYGPNASHFKEGCGRLAADYANSLIQDFTHIAQAVQASTSNISASLGGGQVAIHVETAPIIPPDVPPAAADGTVDVKVDALQALQPVVTAHIGIVRTALQEHLTSLTATDWEGSAKVAAVDAVGRFTRAADDRAAEAGGQINAFIKDQVDAVLQADR